MGTQVKIMSKFDEDSGEIGAPSFDDKAVPSMGRDEAAVDLRGLVAAGVARQWGAVRKNWGVVSDRFPQKLYTSSARLSRSCQKMAARISRELTRAWRGLWR